MCASQSDRDDRAYQQAERELLGQVAPDNWKSPQPRGVYRLVVIGGGPAGIAAARMANRLGARVALVERQRLGGASLNYGSVPTGALLRTARLYSDMRCAATYGAMPPPEITVDFGAAMARMRRIRARVSRTHSAMCLAREGIDLFFGNARFVGKDAIDVISLAMVAGIGLAALARVIHAYPTHGEAIRMAAAACKQKASSRMKAWVLKLWLGG